jgi:hypothetical protein
MPVDRDVVGRVGEDEVGLLVFHQQVEHRPVSGIAADQAMAPQPPYVAGSRHRGARVIHRNGDLVLGIGRSFREAFAGLLEHEVDLGRGETGDLDVKIDRDQALQLDRQQLLVPPGIDGKLVVGQYIGPPLRRIEMGET